MPPTSHDPLEAARRAFLGRWTRIAGDPAGKPYPDAIELQEGGLYRGTRGADDFTVWDVGTYKVEAADRVRISTANDAQIPYHFRFEGGRLTFRDPEGDEIVFEREP